MALGNYTPFRAKHVTGIAFGQTAIPEQDLDSTTTSLVNAFADNCGTGILDLVGAADTNNPTRSYAFAKDFSTSGNERASSEEALLGADGQGSQNTELGYGNNTKITVEFTSVYRNPMVTAIFNDNTRSCLIKLDNNESSTTGELYILFTNIVMEHVGSLTMNADGMMEQKVKFSVRGGFAGSQVAVTDTNSYRKYRVGEDVAEEIRIS